jgi:hypothetical protein
VNAQRVIPFVLVAVLAVGAFGALNAPPAYAATVNQTPMTEQFKTAPPAWGPFVPFFAFNDFRFRDRDFRFLHRDRDFRFFDRDFRFFDRDFGFRHFGFMDFRFSRFPMRMY